MDAKQKRAVTCLKAAKDVCAQLFTVGGADLYGQIVMALFDRLPITRQGDPDTAEIPIFIEDMKSSQRIAEEIFGRVLPAEAIDVYDRVYDPEE